MKAQFAKGDTVKLKSGGPVMTVQGEDFYQTGLVCQWFENGKLQNGDFPPESLKSAEPEE